MPSTSPYSVPDPTAGEEFAISPAWRAAFNLRNPKVAKDSALTADQIAAFGGDTTVDYPTTARSRTEKPLPGDPDYQRAPPTGGPGTGQPTGPAAPTLPTAPTTPEQETVPDWATYSPGMSPDAYFWQIVRGSGLKGAQSDPTVLNTIVDYMKKAGFNVEANKDPHGYYKGINLDGAFVKLLDGSDNWIWETGGDTGGGEGGGVEFAGGGGVAGAGGGGYTYQPGTTTRDPRGTALYDFLMKRAQQGLDVDPNDPVIKGQVEPYNAQLQRDARTYLSQVAESGNPYANITAETRTAGEQVGQRTASYLGSLMQAELSARRTEIENALTNARQL
ncbi:MAG: hypothetical protein V2A79_14095, partial [Planctomycetota bacterium]